MVAFLLFLGGCKKEDDYIYPPVITEILTVKTNSEGTITYLHTDKKLRYQVLNSDRFTGLVPDSVYRGICIYEVHDQATAGIYSFRKIVSPNPIRQEQLPEGIRTDPVGIQSVWRSGDYINVVLKILSQGGRHTIHFIETGWEVGWESRHYKLHLTLYHDRGEDPEGYTQKAYLSVPLNKYKEVLQTGDSILFSINTYEGVKTYSFPY